MPRVEGHRRGDREHGAGPQVDPVADPHPGRGAASSSAVWGFATARTTRRYANEATTVATAPIDDERVVAAPGSRPRTRRAWR